MSRIKGAEAQDEDSRREEWGSPDSKRRHPHQDLLDPRLIYLIGNLPRRKHRAFVGLLDWAKRRKDYPAGKRLMMRLENFIMTSPAIDARQADRIVEMLREHIVGQKESLSAPRGIGKGKGGGGSERSGQVE